MAEKRYAIVRIDEGCPIGQSVFKELELKNVCNASKSCSDCLLGDTKEQLIRKVAQVIAKCRLEREMKGTMYGWEDEARQIVEFLGVR